MIPLLFKMEENIKVGVLGCKLLYEDKTLQSLGENFSSAWEIFKTQILFLKTWKRINIGNNNSQKDNYYRKVDYVSGACLLSQKEVFKKVGLLKEDYFMYGEDAEFCFRVKKAGWEVGVLSNIEIIHIHSKSTEMNLSEMLYHSIKNELKNIEIFHKNKLQVSLAKNYFLIGLLIRSIIAIFRKDKNVTDYLKLFKKLLVNGE